MHLLSRPFFGHSKFKVKEGINMQLAITLCMSYHTNKRALSVTSIKTRTCQCKNILQKYEISVPFTRRWGLRQTLESGPVLQLESHLGNLNKAWLESSTAFQIRVVNLNLDGNIKMSIWMIQTIVTKRNTGNLSAWDWITNKALSPSLSILPHFPIFSS